MHYHLLEMFIVQKEKKLTLFLGNVYHSGLFRLYDRIQKRSAIFSAEPKTAGIISATLLLGHIFM